MISSSNYLIQTKCFLLLLIKAQAEYAYIGNFWDDVWVCFLIFPAFDGSSKIGACPQVSLHSILTICHLSRLHNSPLYPCPRSPGNCWVDQATCEISDWTWTLSHYLNESSHCKSEPCSASGLSTFNTFWFKGLVCDHLIFYEMISCEYRERMKQNNQRRKLRGTKVREIETTHIWYHVVICKSRWNTIIGALCSSY